MRPRSVSLQDEKKLWTHPLRRLTLITFGVRSNDTRQPLHANSVSWKQWQNVLTDLDRPLSGSVWKHATTIRFSTIVETQRPTVSDRETSIHLTSSPLAIIQTILANCNENQQIKFEFHTKFTMTTFLNKRNHDEDGESPRQVRTRQESARLAHRTASSDNEGKQDEELKDDEEQEDEEITKDPQEPNPPEHGPEEVDFVTVTPVNDEPTCDESSNPPDYDTLFSHPFQEKVETFQYTKHGMPIILYKGHHLEEKVLVTPNKDMMRFNETSNTWFLRIGSKLITQMHGDLDSKRETNKLPKENQRQPFDAIIKAELISLQDAHMFEHEAPGGRQLECYWKVFKGFGVPNQVNQELILLRHFYAMIRLGSTSFHRNYDEFEAAICAVKLYFLATTKDTESAGTGAWTIGLVHTLNGHFIHHGYTPMTIGHDQQSHNDTAATRSSFNSRRYDSDGEPFKVENWASVVGNLKSMLLNQATLNQMIPVDLRAKYAIEFAVEADHGTPAAAAAPITPVGARMRVSIG